jgi:hypothetical protein
MNFKYHQGNAPTSSFVPENAVPREIVAFEVRFESRCLRGLGRVSRPPRPFAEGRSQLPLLASYPFADLARISSWQVRPRRYAFTVRGVHRTD